MKCDVIAGSILGGCRQPILYSFVLDKKPGYKVFCEPETIHYKKNKSVLNTITFYSGTKNIVGEITFNKKTGKEIKLLVGKCVTCDRKKSIIVSNNTIQAEGLGTFLKNLGKISAKAGKKIATNALKKPARFLEIGANVATAAAGRNPKAALSTFPEVIKFYHTGKGLYLGKFV